MLINASEKFKQLKKSKGSKRKEMDDYSRREIVETLNRFEDAFDEDGASMEGRQGINPRLSTWKSAQADSASQPAGDVLSLSKGLPRTEQAASAPRFYACVFDKEFFYFNKQAIMLTNVDEQGKALSKSIKLSPTKLENGQREITEFDVDTVPKVSSDSEINHSNLRDVFEKDIKPFVDSLDYKEQPLVVTTPTAKYYYDNEKETLIKESKEKKEALGCGKIVVKAAYKKVNKRQGECVEITVELTPDTKKDYEIIPFSMDITQNQAEIAAFMAKYVSKPFEYQDNVVGVEINFNKVFYSPEGLSDVADILGEIDKIENELRLLEEGLGL
jgi:type I restriction enzyme M protein